VDGVINLQGTSIDRVVFTSDRYSRSDRVGAPPADFFFNVEVTRG